MLATGWIGSLGDILAQSGGTAALERLADAREAVSVVTWIDSKLPWIDRQLSPGADVQRD